MLPNYRWQRPNGSLSKLSATQWLLPGPDTGPSRSPLLPSPAAPSHRGGTQVTEPPETPGRISGRRGVRGGCTAAAVEHQTRGGDRGCGDTPEKVVRGHRLPFCGRQLGRIAAPGPSLPARRRSDAEKHALVASSCRLAIRGVYSVFSQRRAVIVMPMAALSWWARCCQNARPASRSVDRRQGSSSGGVRRRDGRNEVVWWVW